MKLICIESSRELRAPGVITPGALPLGPGPQRGCGSESGPDSDGTRRSVGGSSGSVSSLDEGRDLGWPGMTWHDLARPGATWRDLT